MINPSQMQKMMRQLGIKSRELSAEEVVIKTSTSTITIKNPQVVEMEVQGKKMFQVVGEPEVVPFNEEDIGLVSEQAGVSRQEAVELLRAADGDVARAIMLKKQE